MLCQPSRKGQPVLQSTQPHLYINYSLFHLLCLHLLNTPSFQPSHHLKAPYSCKHVLDGKDRAIMIIYDDHFHFFSFFTMPSLKLKTNVPRSALPPNFTTEVAEIFQKAINKPLKVLYANSNSLLIHVTFSCCCSMCVCVLSQTS